MSFYFVMVGTKDNPVYEAELGPALRSDAAAARRDENKHLNQFVAHSALDVVEEMAWGTSNLYLKHVDRFNERLVSAFVTPSNMRFLMLHEAKSDDGLRAFFAEVHELYIKVLLNPFYEPNMPIRSFAFDTKVRLLAKKFL